jgi:hypothetical protein
MVNLWLAAVVEAGILPRREFACKVRLSFMSLITLSICVSCLLSTCLSGFFCAENGNNFYILSFCDRLKVLKTKINTYTAPCTYRPFSPLMQQPLATTATSTVSPAICTALQGRSTAAAVRTVWARSTTTALGQVRVGIGGRVGVTVGAGVGVGGRAFL